MVGCGVMEQKAPSESVRITKGLARRVRAHARRTGRTARHIMDSAVREYLDGKLKYQQNANALDETLIDDSQKSVVVASV